MKLLNFAQALLSALIMASLLSCSGGRSIPEADSAGSDEKPAPMGLPALAGLATPERDLSELAADGFLHLDPVSPLMTGNAVDGGGFLTLDNGINVPTYAIYGVGGFDGDNYPVSLQLNVGAGGGQFYVAFSDYLAGNWAITGPFNASGEFGIPMLDGYDDPGAFVSALAIHYFAVIVPNGNVVNIDSLSLGVSGGDNAPQAVISINSSGSDGNFYIQWLASASSIDPDFAGYIVEKAPLLGGSFVPMSASPSLQNYLLDADPLAPETNRYRIATYDLSGNRSLSSSRTMGPVAGNEAAPVLVVQMPRGPLYGPADITMDLGDSFDPQNEGITEYRVIAYTPLSSESAAPLVNLTLQPGCHLFYCEVKCADGRSANGFYFLRVLPQWQPDSTVLRATVPTGIYKDARLSRIRGGVQPGDGLTTLCALDLTAAALTFWHQSGSEMLPYRVNTLEEVAHVGEPVTDGNNLIFPVSSLSDYYLASFDGEKTSLLGLGENNGYLRIELVKDLSGGLWVLHAGEDAGAEKLYIDQIGGTNLSSEIGTAANPVDYVSAALDPVSGHIFGFYDDGTALNYAEFDPATASAIGSGPVGVANFSFVVDAELNPENGRIGVLYYDSPTSQIRYLEQDGVGGWTLPVDIDASDNNIAEASLEASDGGHLNAFFALDNGQQAHRYIYSGGIWGSENTVAYSSDSGYDVALIPVTGSPDMRVVDNCGDGVIRLARLKEANTENVFASIDSAVGQGFDMHAAIGTDGLHLIYQTFFDGGNPVHLLSAPGPGQGSSWTEENTITAYGGLNLSSTSTGEVYATGYSFPNAELYFWDTGTSSFTSDKTFAGVIDCRPMLGPDMLSEDISFAVWDPGAPGFFFLQGKHGFYDPPGLMPAPSHTPLWEGCIVPNSGQNAIFALAGPTQSQPATVFGTFDSEDFDILNQTVVNGDPSPFGKSSMEGRLLDSALYWGGELLLGGVSLEMVSANGLLTQPTRYTRSYFATRSTTDIPMGDMSEDLELRRSVSVCNVSGLTAVELLASIDGKQTWFAWSNYDRWQQLPLPDGLDNMSLPLMVCGNDGRWHIIYKDWKTDNIMIRSTI